MLEKLENRIIFMKNGSEKPEHLQAVEELAQTFMSMRLGCVPYFIDVSKGENRRAIASFLEKRGVKLAHKAIQGKSFILGNKFNDIWFQALDLVGVFQ